MRDKCLLGIGCVVVLAFAEPSPAELPPPRPPAQTPSPAPSSEPPTDALPVPPFQPNQPSDPSRARSDAPNLRVDAENGVAFPTDI